MSFVNYISLQSLKEEHYGYLKVAGDLVNIYKNPSFEELKENVESFNRYGEAKIFLDANDLYVFDGLSANHENIVGAKQFKEFFSKLFAGFLVVRKNEPTIAKINRSTTLIKHYTPELIKMIEENHYLNSNYKQIIIGDV